MRLACLSDCHIDEKTPYFADHVAAMRRLIADAATYKVDAFLIGGDMAGRTSAHRLTDAEREAWADLLIEMSNHAPVYGVTGNHDVRMNWPITDRLRTTHAVHITTKPERIGCAIGEWNIALRPYMTQPEISGLSDLPIEQRNAEAGRLVLGRGDAHTICVAHFPAEGAAFGSYEVQTAQDVTLSRQALDESGYAYIHLGHIHARQQVAERAFYPGSPCPLSFGESGPKGYNLVEMVPGEKPRVEFREITSWRMETIRVPLDERLLAFLQAGAIGQRPSWVPEPLWDGMVAKSTVNVEPSLSDAHVRVVLETPADFHGHVPRREIKDLLTRADALSVQIDVEQAERERSRSAAVVAAQTDDDRLRAALAEQQITGAEADRLVGVSNGVVARGEV